MDIVIPLGTGSRWQNNELRFALRSIEKYLTGYDKIFIIGECPNWLNLEERITQTRCGFIKSYPEKPIIHIHCPDFLGRKEYSIFNKIMKAVADERCSDYFVFWNDDIFLIDNLQTADFKFWYEGTLQSKYEQSHGHYKAAIKNVIDISKPDDYYTDIHTPIIYNKDCFYKYVACNNWDKEYVIKSSYTSVMLASFEPMPDLKINKAMTYYEIKARIKDRLFFSIGTYGVCPAMTKVLTELFPDKSKYEK